SSLLTVLCSTVILDRLRGDNADAEFVGFAGYSVGQWTALYAAGALDSDTLFRTVHARALVMNECLPAGRSGMVAVIGVREPDLQHLCAQAREAGHALELTNNN